jgi:prevent-host-death family protein
MKRRLSAVEARKHLGEILEGVFYRGDEVVIERAGKPMAAVIPPERYRTMEQNRERLLEIIERIHERTKDIPPEELQRDIDEAVREVRREAAHKSRRRKAG